MASFDNLFSKSAKFRNIFVGDGRFYASMDKFDFVEVQELWENRWPYIEWGFCKADGCKGLVGKPNKYCSDHISHSGALPRYVWYGNILYKFFALNTAGHEKVRKKQYASLAKLVATDNYGKVPSGYKVMFSDGNYLNHRRENIVLMTVVSAIAVDAGVISVADSAEVDFLLKEFTEKRFGDGPKPFRHAYDYDDIAEASGLTKGAIRRAVRDDRLDPRNLLSVLEFVNNAKKNDNLIEVHNGR